MADFTAMTLLQSMTLQQNAAATAENIGQNRRKNPVRSAQFVISLTQHVAEVTYTAAVKQKSGWQDEDV